MKECAPNITFLCLSNARCGSTHLITALNRITGLSCDYELKWRIAYQPGQVHLPVGPGDDIGSTIREKINADLAVGSKLVFDPYAQTIIDTDNCKYLIESLKNTVFLIHLTRNYFDSFVSMFYRGAHHQVGNLTEATSSMLASDALEKQQAKPELRLRIDPAAIPITILNMFHNDMLAMELCERAQHSMQVKYDELDHRLGDIATFLGADISEVDLAAITGNPTIQKLPALDLSGLGNVDALRSFTGRLGQALDHYLTQGLPPMGRPLVFHASGDGHAPRIEITDPYLRNLLGAGAAVFGNRR